MQSKDFFEVLLRAESESEVETILKNSGYLEDDSQWQPLGDVENNFSTVGNQQSEPTAALVEKIINSMDAVLMLACFKEGLNPEGKEAPKDMNEAVERFFKVRNGQLGSLSAKERTRLAEMVNLVAVGGKDNPCYLIIDRGEGQSPCNFRNTLLSIMKSNRLRIPFVQGKFNMGGTGVLPFCGIKKYELIVSRRNPSCPTNDDSSDLWGFTIVRRMLPKAGLRASMYVFLAPDNKILTFYSPSIKVLPGSSSKNSPAEAYAENLDFGTCIKLYDYRWKAKSTATTEARYELERYLLSPCLPFRVTETRNYKANYYSTTVSGIWAALHAEETEETPKAETGFPAPGELNLSDIGKLPYRMVVYKEEVDERHVPHGIYFTLNGQVHGAFPSDFINRRLGFDYLSKHLLVSIDCNEMQQLVREDFFMGSRDRIRQNEILKQIEEAIEDELKAHPGLRAMNAARRKKSIEKALENERDTVDTLQRLLKADPTLAGLFSTGDRLVTNVGPGEPPPFKGKKFPTYFRLVKEPKGGFIKPCPINRACRVEFETDAENDYFIRLDSPGIIEFNPPYVCENWNLWNGKLIARFRLPKGAKAGQLLSVLVTVQDIQSENNPFICNFNILAQSPSESESRPPGQPAEDGSKGSGRQTAARLSTPKVILVSKEEWTKHEPNFSELESLRVKNDGNGGYDFYLNTDNAFLLTELVHSKMDEQPLVKYWFKWGLVICAMGMLQHLNAEKNESKENSEANSDDGNRFDSIDLVNRSSFGLARVIVPIVRGLYKGPKD
jgi:hypothetical protein